MSTDPQNDAARLNVETLGTNLKVLLAGRWSIGSAVPERREVRQAITDNAQIDTISFDSTELGDWDSSLLSTVAELRRLAEQKKIAFSAAGLPSGLQSLLDLAFAVAEREGARRTQQKDSFLATLGKSSLEIWSSVTELIEFTGELILSFKRAVTRKAIIQPSQVWLAVQEAGAEALPIVSLISVLMGMIFAFVGVTQLANFGAGLYTADLVALAMVREMAPIMTGILMAGRTGAAYAAQLGTMKVNEEIDALTTLGINPMDFLVLPKFLALLIMMPLLTLYASVLGIFGGMAVAVSMLDVTVLQYGQQTMGVLTWNILLGGLFKAFVYGGLVALAGTQQGIACGSSALAVGVATTRAVVTGIVLIVVSAAILTVIYINLGI